MDVRLKECLENKEFDYLFPFLWIRGESHSRLEEEIIAIKNSGINSFCVESRVHEGFCKEQWWADFEFILKTAKKMEMKVWLMDDKSYPCGNVMCAIKNNSNYTHLRKRYLIHKVVDVLGPQKDVMLFTDYWTKDTDKLVRAVAYKRTGEGVECDGEPIDITSTFEDNTVNFDLPDGMWRVFFVFESNRFQGNQPYYIDMLNPDSTQLVINEIYEPHYEHFKEYFGNTFVGFFSDEPCFSNDCDTYASNIGKNMILPYNPVVIPMMAEILKLTEEEVWGLIPGLWANIGENTAKIRVAYMDVVTRLYAKNYSEKLGNWCREKGILYTGHIIEDMNANMHLGNSAGHYFRALDAQSIAGIDVVLHQVMPGQNEMMHTARIFDRIADPTFFVYALAKLAASHAHINPGMNNRAMCEIYGAYGFAEGLPFMKKLSDHFLASGINRYVPHAFDPKYPDENCPPHFYCEGMNPQFELFGELMRYKQRVIHLFEGGVHQASALVYYNAECEWSGSETDLYFHVAKVLTQNQIDFDFIPQDYLSKVVAQNGKLNLNQETYHTIILPGCSMISDKTDKELLRFKQNGISVIFCDRAPERIIEGGIPLCREFATIVPYNELASYLRSIGIFDIALSQECPYLRFYHINRDDKDIYMFKNDGNKPLCTEIILKQNCDIVVYDAWSNSLKKKSNNGCAILELAAGDSAIWILGEDSIGLEEKTEVSHCTEIIPSLKWDIDIERVENKKRIAYKRNSELINITGRGEVKDFAGKVYYKTFLNIDNANSLKFIDLGYVGETAKLYVNGNCCGTLISEPYCFNVNGMFKEGENIIEIEVVTSAIHKERDYFSRYMKIMPMGILGPVKLLN